MSDQQCQQQAGRNVPVADVPKHGAQERCVYDLLNNAQRLIGTLPKQGEGQEPEQKHDSELSCTAAHEDRCHEADSREQATGDHRKNGRRPAGYRGCRTVVVGQPGQRQRLGQRWGHVLDPLHARFPGPCAQHFCRRRDRQQLPGDKGDRGMQQRHAGCHRGDAPDAPHALPPRAGCGKGPKDCVGADNGEHHHGQMDRAGAQSDPDKTASEAANTGRPLECFMRDLHRLGEQRDADEHGHVASHKHVQEQRRRHVNDRSCKSRRSDEAEGLGGLIGKNAGQADHGDGKTRVQPAVDAHELGQQSPDIQPVDAHRAFGFRGAE